MPYWRATLALCHFMLDQYEDAAKEARLGMQANTALPGNPLILAASLARAGRAEEARQIVESYQPRHPQFRTASVARVLLSNEPRLVSGRERLVSTLRALGVP
jgi:hypothetical protein